jgi:hypothetical protein
MDATCAAPEGKAASISIPAGGAFARSEFGRGAVIVEDADIEKP